MPWVVFYDWNPQCHKHCPRLLSIVWELCCVCETFNLACSPPLSSLSFYAEKPRGMNFVIASILIYRCFLFAIHTLLDNCRLFTSANPINFCLLWNNYSGNSIVQATSFSSINGWQEGRKNKSINWQLEMWFIYLRQLKWLVWCEHVVVPASLLYGRDPSLISNHKGPYCLSPFSWHLP